MTERQYRRQRHPRSCEADEAARRTASPVPLADTAAWLACKALADVTGVGESEAEAAFAWYGMQTTYAVETNRLVRSQLVGNPHCRGDHDQRWSTPIRAAGERALSTLRAVLQESFSDGSDAGPETRIRFCRHVAFRGRCQNCHQDAELIHWVGCHEDQVGWCAVCGGALKTNGFDRHQATTIDRLSPVLDRPFDHWGVADGAVVELTRYDRRVTWVLGNRLPTTSWGAENCRFAKGEP